MGSAVRVFLCGDVMLGRGVDQILPSPGDPTLHERYVSDARTYVDMAETRTGRIPNRVDYAWPWGDALRMLHELAPDVRVGNLETSITRSGDFAPGKAVHYRMSPDNVPCLAAVAPDVCALANNHVLDFGRTGLADTLVVLSDAGLGAVGAGGDARAAREPAIVPVRGDTRVIVFACGMPSSGIPPSWAAGPMRSGVNLVPDLSDRSAAEITDQFSVAKRCGDIVVVSVHWGSNWGYDVSPDQRHFAHRLLDGGADIVHGHSSHHPRPIEIYRDKLVLYGCGDFVNDYEGIASHESFRDDLRLMYFAAVDPDTGALTALRLAAMQARQMRLHHASPADEAWLRTVLDRISRPFATRVDSDSDGMLTVRAT